ncbi:hypothetical protein LG272_10955 [Pseudidiomarina marina]|uniref:hypothetical protein n=1 Tax=Pseudidiomarina marina TaxID=502366 RepID=UPI00384E11E5
MTDTKGNNTSNYSFDLARMTEAVEGNDSDDVVVLTGPMTVDEIQKTLEQAYYDLVAQEG